MTIQKRKKKKKKGVFVFNRLRVSVKRNTDLI